MIRAWSRIFVFEGIDKRASDLHLESSAAKTEALFFFWAEVRIDSISVGRWRDWSLSGKIILVSVAKVGGSSGPFMIGFVEGLTDGSILGVESRGFGEGEEHFTGGGIGRTVADFNTVGSYD